MPGLLDAELKAWLQEFEGKDSAWLCEFDLVLTPGAAATTVRIGIGASSWSTGNYEGLVTKIGDHSRGMGILETGLQFSEVQVEIADGSRFWSTLIAGPVGKSVRRSAARIRLSDRNLSSFSKAFLYFDGVIDRWEFGEDQVITLYLRPNEVMLRRPFPEFMINDLIYPFADPESWGRFGTFLYGIEDSSGGTRTGSLPAFLIDSTDHSYYAMLGTIEITAVFGDGEPLTDYTLVLETDGGWDVQKIRFTEDIGDTAITFDAKGYKNNSGALILNPASITAHVLRNHVLGQPVGTRWTSGAWLTANAGLNVGPGTGFQKVADYYSQRNRTGAHYLDSEAQHYGDDIINEILSSEFIQAYFRNDGKLDLDIFDPAQRRPTTDVLYIRNSDVAGLRPTYDAAGIVKKISTQYKLDPISGQYRNVLEVADVLIASEGTTSHQQPWGPGNEGDLVLISGAPDEP